MSVHLSIVVPHRYFDAVCTPYLRNKADKMFLDHWLLFMSGLDQATAEDVWRPAETSGGTGSVLGICTKLRPLVET